MKTTEKAKTWKKTSVQNLMRHKSGRYYARTWSGGKEIWKSLKTTGITVAKARLADFVKEQRERESVRQAAFEGDMTVGAAIELHKKDLTDNLKLKPATRHYWNQIMKSLLKSWPELAETDVKKITPADCRSWAVRFEKKASSTRYNNTVSALRHVFDKTIEFGARYNNPAMSVQRKPVRQNPLILPNRREFGLFIDAMEKAGGRFSRDCADFVRFLAYSGCRKGEASQVKWRDVDFDRGELLIRGDSETGTKNWEIRRIPLIPDLKSLLQRMRLKRSEEPPEHQVLKVAESQKAMDHAAKSVGMSRITHHDLRHLFATICIESGVDTPTVSRWLGHKDGGVLAMKIYGHLRDDHSKTSAEKVQFFLPAADESSPATQLNGKPHKV